MTKTARNASVSREQGFTMIETMVAAVVLGIAILGLVSAVTSAVIVDAVADENNAALHAARLVMEQVKSENFAALLAKRNYIMPPISDPTSTAADDPVTGGGGGEEGGDGEQDNPYDDPYYMGVYSGSEWLGDGCAYDGYSVFSTYYSDYGDQPSTDWYGESLPDTQAEADAANSILIDSNGNFGVVDPRIGALEPWDPPWPGASSPPVGAVRVSSARDANGDLVTDVVDIVVMVRWKGQRGNSMKVLRSQVADWRL